MATDSLFILYLLTPVEFQSISRDLAQERETEDKSSGERARTERRDVFVLSDGLWPHTARQTLMGSLRNLLRNYGAHQLIV